MSTPQDSKDRFWRSPAGIVFAIFVGVAGFLLVSEHGAHFLGAAPLLLILAVCVGMHFFMHGGYGEHGAHGSETDEDDTSHGRGGGHGY